MASSNTDGSTSNGTLPPRSITGSNGQSRDYDALKQLYDMANNELNALRRRCDHTLKELDYYRNHHRAAINQLEASSQDSAALRTKYSDILKENQILEQDLQTIRNELSDCRRRQSSFQENGNSESLFMLARHNEAVREDYDTLRTRYDDLLTSHTQAITKLEVSQDENLRLSKQYEELSQERNSSLREMGSQKQHLSKAYEKMVRECNKYRDALKITQKKHEDAVQELKLFKMKAGKEVQRLKEERNATMTEYNLIMSERDTVHKEMEKLSDENSQTKLKIKLLEADNKELLDEKQSISYQMECLRREITSALHDRDKAIKECNDLREKFGEYSSKEDSQYLIKSRLDSLNLLENSDRSKEAPIDSRSFAQRLQRLDNLDQANQELESLRKSLDKTLTELGESKQEAEVSKKRRDWAFSERDKIVLERESIRTLCDNMRKERDRAVSDLAESLRESDAVKRHSHETFKENKRLKEVLENVSRDNTNSSATTCGSGGSDATAAAMMMMDHEEYETDVVEIEYGAGGTGEVVELGFELGDSRDTSMFSEECGVYVCSVRKESVAEGKLKVHDQISHVNGVSCGCAMRYAVLEAIRRAILDRGVVRLTVRRRRWSQSQVTRWVHTAKLAAGCHGLSLESGVYIAAISQGSLAAQDKTLVVGDRVLRINQISMGSIDSLHEALSLLNDNRADAITLTTLKMSYLNHDQSNNVFAPAQRYKKENRSSQTDDCLYHGCQPQAHKHLPTTTTTNSTWFKDKFDLVRGRRPSKDRTRNEDKKKYRNSSPLDPNWDQEQALATLDLVIESYHGGTSKRVNKKHNSKEKTSGQEKNGGTWPKARVSNGLHSTTTGTIVARKKERPPLSLLISEDYNYTAPPIPPQSMSSSNRNSTPVSMSLAPSALHRHGPFKSIDYYYQPTVGGGGGGGGGVGGGGVGGSDFDKLRVVTPKELSRFDNRDRDRDARHMKSDDSLDFPVSGKPSVLLEKDDLFCDKGSKRSGAETPKYGSDCDRDPDIPPPRVISSPPHHLITSAPRHHTHNNTFAPLTLGRPLLPFPSSTQHQHHHNILNTSPLLHSSPTTTVVVPLLGGGSGHQLLPPPPPPPPPRTQSRESFIFEPSGYLPFQHRHSHSPSLLDSSGGLSRHHHQQPQQGIQQRELMMMQRQQQGVFGRDGVDVGGGVGSHSMYGHQFDVGTFPRKREDPRFRIPSTTSVTSKTSLGKVSTGSIERTSERGGGGGGGGGSPMPIFHVEVLSPGTTTSSTTVSSVTSTTGGVTSPMAAALSALSSVTGSREKRHSVPAIVAASSGGSGGGHLHHYHHHHHPHQHHHLDQWPHKPLPGELRRVHIDKSNEPLGIQINCNETGGIFVSTVNEHSLASRVGLQIGDQLLEVCGINMRNATYNLAANVLRQCGNSITMLVQYSPDKYNELEGSGSCNSSSSNEDNEPTPCNSPKETRKLKYHHPGLALPRSITSTPPNATHQQQASGVSLPPPLPQHSQQSQQQQLQQLQQTLLPRNLNTSNGPPSLPHPLPSGTLLHVSATSSSASSSAHHPHEEEPRYLCIETLKTSNLGITLVGGNAVGIFVHAVKSDSLAYHAGLRTGDQILEYNGGDLRQATAEEAAYELAKPADKVTVLAQYRIDRYNEIQDKPGDSFYVRCGFDRSGSELTDNMQLCFNKDDVLYVDNTMFKMYNSSPGFWRAWKLDAEGHRQLCGVIPSKYKVEEELLLRRSSGDLENRISTSARRSFFRRNKKHQRNGSRDSKELASFCNVTSGWYSDNGTLHEDLSLCSYQRVERLDFPEYRPVLVLGPLAECVVDKLVTDFPDKFGKVVSELRHCSQAALDQEMTDNVIVDYRRKGSYFECTTVSAIRNVCTERLHCMLDISISSVDKLHGHQLYPIVLLIKFKSTKQIKEVKDARNSIDKLTGKAAKEMYEHCQKIELEYKHQITAVIPAGVNIAYMCTQVKAAIDFEHNKSQWVTVQ